MLSVTLPPSELNRELCSRFSRWLGVQGYTSATRRHYLVSVSAFCEFLDKLPAPDATHLDIRDFLAVVAQRGLKRASIHREMYALRCFFDFLNLGGLINWAPPRFIRMRRIERSVPRVLSEKQVRALLAATQNIQERAMMEVLYGTGARAGEVRSMRVEDVDLQARRIWVVGKSGPRFLLFPKSITNCVRKYIGNRREGFLFVNRCPPQTVKIFLTKNGIWRSYYYAHDPNRGCSRRFYWYLPHGKGLTRKQALRRVRREMPHSVRRIPVGQKPLGCVTVRYVVKRVGLRIGIHVNPFILRHTFATHLLDHGADIRMIQKMLGHVSVGSTQAYTFVSMKQVQKALDKYHPRNL
jgi:site-specific recombinase XerD